jgi:hypothetical protein
LTALFSSYSEKNIIDLHSDCEMCTKMWFDSRIGGDYSKDLGVDGRIIIKRDIRQ